MVGFEKQALSVQSVQHGTDDFLGVIPHLKFYKGFDRETCLKELEIVLLPTGMVYV